MQISHIKANNYRNIEEISVKFNPEVSYVIGENNLGKSNFLALLSTVCNGKGFDDRDFLNPEEPIEVEIEIKMLVHEQGFFGDNFSPEDSSCIKIRYRQTIKEAYPTIVNIDTNESIPSRLIRKINFLKYETTASPSRELRLDTQKGAGLLINGIIERFISGSEETPVFLNNIQIDGLIGFINNHLKKIRSFNDYAIKATISPNLTDMLTNMFYLSDGERKIDNTGSGVQFMAMASINILCQIMELYKSKANPFSEQLYTDENGKIILPLVLSVDEPEVHLHPYLQRSIIGYYKRILRNKDAGFLELLKLCFDIDGIDGQLIIVTHSTDALIGDYRNLIRFYKANDKTSVISGADPALSINSTNEKHLIMHFPEIKEAFYAHCALLIEGETEYGCIRSFADKKEISLDDNGICLINARGEGSIKPLRNLLEVFAVKSVAIYDGDVKGGQTPSDFEFFTQELCFEIEIVKALYQAEKQSLVRQIVLALDNNAESVLLDKDFIRKPFKKMNIDIEGYIPIKLQDVDNNNEDNFIHMLSAWFMVKKGVLLGRIIGELMPVELIPSCYTNAIIKAQEGGNSCLILKSPRLKRRFLRNTKVMRNS